MDWPSAAYWPELGKAFPDAKFIHTERNEDDWYRSFQATIQAPSTGPFEGVPKDWNDMAIATINDRVFGGRGTDESACRQAFRANSLKVREDIPASQRLIFEASQGWGPLCSFLGVDIPDEPYPHKNSTEDFQARGG